MQALLLTLFLQVLFPGSNLTTVSPKRYAVKDDPPLKVFPQSYFHVFIVSHLFRRLDDGKKIHVLHV